jgi:hypothetical protein
MTPLKRLECLPANFFMGEGVYDNHAEYHDMPGDARGLGVMNLHCFIGSQTVNLDQEETARVSIIILNSLTQYEVYALLYKMRSGMDNSIEEHGISNLSMEPCGNF